MCANLGTFAAIKTRTTSYKLGHDDAISSKKLKTYF